MLKLLMPILATSVLLLTGCEETQSETARDVGQARQDASENVADARRDASKAEASADSKVSNAQADYNKTDASATRKLSKVESDAMITRARGDFDVAIAQAEGRYAVAREKCGGLSPGVTKDSCLSTAEAALEAEKSAATARQDNALVAADYRG